MDSLRIYVDLALPPDALALLRAGTAGHELVFPAKPVTSVLAKGEPDPQFTTVDVAFGQPDVQSISETKKLRWVHVSSAGITRYDTQEFRALATGRGLAVSNSSGVFDEACAVHVLSFLLAQTRQLPAGLRTRTPHGSDAWQALREASGTLRDETILILGYGSIGRRLAELLQPFGSTVMAHRRKARGDEGIPVVTADGLPAALAEADHVVNILPESSETRGFFNRDRFTRLKPGAVFYNIGRGATVDQEALAGALHSGHLRAAWLDVTDPEPLHEGHPLLSEPTCFITPHTAGGHTGEATTLVRHFLKNLERFVRGDALIDRVI
jgi:phosphoglycerate dehydrogenase-like enzyme